MRLQTLVSCVDEVARTPARNGKVAALAGLFRALTPGDVPVAVALVAGRPRQGKVGVGWASLGAVSVPPAASPSLDVSDLDDALARIASTTGAGSGAARATILRDLLSRATAAEQDFVRRAVLGELRHGALEGVAVEAVALAAGVPAAAVRRALMLAGDLGVVAAAAFERGSDGLTEIGFELLRPVKPMLASTAADVDAALAAAGRASVEWKLDGIRVHVHRDGGEVRVFTRNLNDITDAVPGIVRAALALPEERFVLDGEGMGDGAHYFDCLYLDRESLVDRPLAERVQALEATGARRVPSVVTDDPAEASRVLEAALEAGHEGVVVKAIESAYTAGRRGKIWVKVKRAKTVDLVILGAEWGSGRRRGWLSNLHLGARTETGEFVMVGKTFKGLTDAMLTWQTGKLLSMETSRDEWTVFVEPSLVAEIALDGVMASDRYEGGVGLRFARVIRYREDKPAAEATTVGELRALFG